MTAQQLRNRRPTFHSLPSYFQHLACVMAAGHNQLETGSEYPAMGPQSQLWRIVLLGQMPQATSTFVCESHGVQMLLEQRQSLRERKICEVAILGGPTRQDNPIWSVELEVEHSF